MVFLTIFDATFLYHPIVHLRRSQKSAGAKVCDRPAGHPWHLHFGESLRQGGGRHGGRYGEFHGEHRER